MPVHNEEIALIFDELADLLEIEEANPFRVRAYRNAARVVGEQRFDLAERLAEEGGLPKLPGIGEDLSAKIREIAASGSCVLRERLAKRAPAGITELLHLPGLGPKRVRALNRELDVHSLAQLVRAAKDGRLRVLAGFGAKTEKRLLDAALAQVKEPHVRMLVDATKFEGWEVEKVQGERDRAHQKVFSAECSV